MSITFAHKFYIEYLQASRCDSMSRTATDNELQTVSYLWWTCTLLFICKLFSNDELVPGWKMIVHPTGPVYFFHSEKVIYFYSNTPNRISFICLQKIFTDAWILDTANLTDIMYVYDILSARLAILGGKSGIHNISDFELVLDLTQHDNGDNKCGYYYVDHVSRSLFWLDEFDARSISKVPIVSFSHLGAVFGMIFWGVAFPDMS